MPGRSPACFSFIYRNILGISLKTRYGRLGILGHSLRNIIPFVGNRLESEVDTIQGGKDFILHPLIHTRLVYNLKQYVGFDEVTFD